MKVDRFSITRISNRILGNFRNNNKNNNNQHAATFTISGNYNETTLDLDNRTVSSTDSDYGSYLTREPLPRLEYYRTSKRRMKRPSLGELHGDLDRKPVRLDGIMETGENITLQTGTLSDYQLRRLRWFDVAIDELC
ncbi:uncharacterized protein LOC131696152 isoform X1 [Topomyia yanbarensis]|uniref:uncharacterized protein LOC131696152 isoform X1 n=1 Tax=Topomyia yanbarensis TaxID=2498891 RepID=UPI00273C8775|nr:uncharacterized protein LOC131696152 isoform X1 [Topomyia yanbarensis]